MTSDNTPKSGSARERILARVRANRPRSVEHPDVPLFTIAGESEKNFISHVEGFDGKVVTVGSRDEAIDWLRKNVAMSDTTPVYSAVAEFQGNITIEKMPRPADAHVLQSCVGEGLLGIGETGSVLVDADTFGRMANGLFAINLYLLLDRSKIVDGLQHAYAQMDLARIQYSSLFSGPSATADIEAVHITGAQGPVSLTVLLY